MAYSYYTTKQISSIGLRFFTVYGPWARPDMALFKFTKAIIAGEKIQVFNYGKHKRDFTYIDDVVEGVIRVLDKPANANQLWNGDNPDSGSSMAPWRVYNIGNNSPVELLDYISAIETKLDKKAITNLLPLQPGDVKDTYADVGKLVSEFNYFIIIIEGFVVGILTGLVGAGGGFLIIPALVLFANLPMKRAVATSLMIISIKSLIGFLGDIGNIEIDWEFLIMFSILSIIGIIIGIYLSNFIDGKKIKKAFGWFVLVMAIYIIYKEILF